MRYRYHWPASLALQGLFPALHKPTFNLSRPLNSRQGLRLKMEIERNHLEEILKLLMKQIIPCSRQTNSFLQKIGSQLASVLHKVAVRESNNLLQCGSQTTVAYCSTKASNNRWIWQIRFSNEKLTLLSLDFFFRA